MLSMFWPGSKMMEPGGMVVVPIVPPSKADIVIVNATAVITARWRINANRRQALSDISSTSCKRNWSSGARLRVPIRSG